MAHVAQDRADKPAACQFGRRSGAGMRNRHKYNRGNREVKELSNEIGAAAAKVSPPLTVAVAGASGWGVQEWMYAATFVYVVAQLGYLLWKWRREAKRKP